MLLATIAMCVFWAAERIRAEPLLSCVLAGLVITNRRGEHSGQASHDELKSSLSHIMPVVNMAFFGLAGASVRLVRAPHIAYVCSIYPRDTYLHL